MFVCKLVSSLFLALDCVFETEMWCHACLSSKSRWPLTSHARSLQCAGVVCVSVVSDRCVCFFSLLAEVEKIWGHTGTTSRLQRRISRPGHSCDCRPSRYGPAAHENCCCFISGLDMLPYQCPEWITWKEPVSCTLGFSTLHFYICNKIDCISLPFFVNTTCNRNCKSEFTLN